MKLSEKIKLLRTSNEMTQPELSAKTGIEQSYLSKLENDKGSPSFDIINKIAHAFDMTGMELINSLGHSYIEKNLTHIPEVSAEFMLIKKQKVKKIKRGYILASLLVALGSGLLFYGIKSAWVNVFVFPYQSDGVYKSGETPYQFNNYPIKEIGESAEESLVRRKANHNRIDIKREIFTEEKGEMFIVEVDGGHRMYKAQDALLVQKNKFNLIAAAGVMLLVLGCLVYLFNSKLKSLEQHS